MAVRCKGERAQEIDHPIKGIQGYSLASEFFVHMAQVIE
jgi:hypothetical protein